MIVAAVGDVHDNFLQMVAFVAEKEQALRTSVSMLLQVGDFQCNRNAADLATMAAPAKYRTLGDFADFHDGRSNFPWPVYFIGGNHEPYGWLEQMPDGGDITTNCRYLGRTGSISLHGLKVVGLSGIYREDRYRVERPSRSEFRSRSNKDYTYFNERDFERALAFESADVLMLHDWPSEIVAEVDRAAFDAEFGSENVPFLGNPIARELIELLEPQLVICGHMHRPYRTTMPLQNGKTAQIVCLDSVANGARAVEIFQVHTSGTAPIITRLET